MTERIDSPAARPASQFDANPFEPLAPMAATIANGRLPTCLVVEDDSTIRHLVTNYLEDHEIRAISASRRDEVARLLERGQPDLVVLDLRLGKEKGLDLLREIRAASDVPVIITTGHRCEEIDRVLGLELGADDYITKPFGLRELLARIRGRVEAPGSRPGGGAAQSGEGPLPVRKLAGGPQARRLTNSQGEPVTLNETRLRPPYCVPGCAATSDHPRTFAAGNPRSRRCLRPQH